MSAAIGVDVGGTKIAAGVVDGGRVVAKVRRDTPASTGDATAVAILEVVEELRAGHDVAAVGIGVPGLVDAARDDVLLVPNLVWPREPLAGLVAATTGLPTVLENDGNAAAWAEHRYGAAAGFDDVLLVTVGTGIGGGLVLAGRLHRGSNGTAAEVGHLRVVPGGLPCGCGIRGCWEAYGSGGAMTRRARSAVAAGDADGSLLAAMARDRDLDGPLVTAAALAGDDLAVRLLAGTGAWLGQGLASLVAVLDPAVVVVGGGLSDAGDLVLGPLREALATHLTGASARPAPPVVPAALGNDAGVVGAADLAALAAVRTVRA